MPLKMCSFLQINRIIAAREHLLSQEFRRSHSRHLLEQATEMVRIFKPKQISYFSNAEPFHQEGLGLVDNEGVNVTDGCAARGLVNNVAEISSRISQL